MIGEALENHSAKKGNTTALTSGGESIDYRELNQRVVSLSHFLREQNVSSLALELENGPDWIVADLAAVHSEVMLIPVPAYFSEEQNRHLMESVHPDFAIGSSGARVPGLQQAGLKMTGDTPSFSESAKITFTSGSTGSPKGVILQHKKLEHVAESIVTAMSLLDVKKHLCLLPLATLLENVAGVYAPILKGIEVVVPPPEETGLSGSSQLDIEKFAQCINTHQPESVILVPQLLLALITLTEMGIVDTGSLKMIAVGGGKVSRRLLDRAAELGLPVYEGYGLSEAGSVTTLNLPGQTKPGSVGKPLPHAAVRVSPEGEIEVSGTLMDGYLGGHTGFDDWYATGDLGYIDEEGFVFISGRRDNLFVTSYGRNVNPEWIEAELGQSPAVAHVLVHGQALPHNLALIWPRFEMTCTEAAELVDEVNSKLPDYARINEHWVLREPIADDLVTANGRLKRQQVIDSYF